MAKEKEVPAPQTNDELAAHKAIVNAHVATDVAGSKVLTAIAKIMSEVGSVEKRGTNDFHKYKYASAADIAFALQKKVAEAGLIITQTESRIEPKFEDSVLMIEYTFSLSHVSGDTLPYLITKTGMSGLKNSKGGIDDKAVNKCSTAALKYFLLGLFLIPTGDYDDADGEEDKPAGRPTPRGATATKSPEPEKPIEPVSAPVNPETGTVSPHAIPVPMDKDNKGNPVAWASLYIAAIEQAKDSAELEAWVKPNAKLMGDLSKYAPDAHKRIVGVLEQKRKGFEVVGNVAAG